MSQIENLISPSPDGSYDPLNEFESSSPEEFFLFFPSTTGLNKPKKSRGFPTFDSAQSAGNTLNLMEGKNDRIFVIISSKEIKAFTPETGEIPFSNDMFRFSRLNSGAEKFKPKAFQERPNQNSSSDFNSIPKISIPSFSIDPNKPISDSLLETGFNKDLLIPLQNLIQSELGISKLDHNPTQEELNSFYILKELLGLEETNEKIFQVIIEAMKGNFDLSLFNL